MGNKSGSVTRVDKNFLKEIDIKIPFNRISNGLENKKISPREVTRMILNTESWQSLKRELETRPRKK